jgi:uncharacterized membrane protein YgdD (TMEM256/DUF423 family)
MDERGLSSRSVQWSWLVLVAGLLGAAGVAAAAAASHGGEARSLSAIATIALAHAPALVALGLAGQGRVQAIAAFVLATGAVLFVGDLGWREQTGSALFALAAPFGGGALILGWLGLAFSGVVGLLRQPGS